MTELLFPCKATASFLYEDKENLGSYSLTRYKLLDYSWEGTVNSENLKIFFGGTPSDIKFYRVFTSDINGKRFLSLLGIQSDGFPRKINFYR